MQREAGQRCDLQASQSDHDEVAEDAIRSRCKHDYCRACVKSYMTAVEETGATPDCPRCHIPLSIDLDQPEIEQDEDNVKKSDSEGKKGLCRVETVNIAEVEEWVNKQIEYMHQTLHEMRPLETRNGRVW